MGVFDNFPYTNFHDLNLDWLLQAFKKLQDEWDSFGYEVTATAVTGLVPNVTVTGDLTNGLNFEFTLVKGEQGDEGPQGLPGADGNGIASVVWNPLNSSLTFTFTDGDTFTTPSLRGPQGSGLQILDVYPTLADLQTAHPSGNAGDMYQVGTSPNFTLYIWSTSSNTWKNAGALSSPAPSDTTPIVDTDEGSAGTEFAYARGDHYHPTDTSRASVSDLNTLAGRVTTAEGNITTLGNDLDTAEGNITLLQGQMLGKQDTLVPGTNIRLINGNGLVGSGNITLEDLLTLDYNYAEDTTTSNSATIRSYRIEQNPQAASAYLIVSATISSSNSNGSGQTVANILYENTSYARAYAKQEANSTQVMSANALAIIPVVAGITELDINTVCSKSGTKTMQYSILGIGCYISLMS